MNKKIETGRPELHPIPIKSPWYHLGMDFVGPVSPPSLTGNRYTLTISDYFTQFGWAKALPTKEAEKKLALKRRQRKQTRDLNEGTPVCVEEHQSKQTVNMWILRLELSSSDREILLSPTAWLTDCQDH